MEEIYDPSTYSATVNFNIKEYFTKYSELCKLNSPFPVNNSYSANCNIKEVMGVDITLNKVKALHEICSIKHLTCEEETEERLPILSKSGTTIVKVPNLFKITDDTIDKLEVLKIKKKIEENRELYLSYRESCSNVYEPEIKSEKENEDENLVPGSAMIIRVRVYRPSLLSSKTNKKYSHPVLKCSHEIELLGTNTVADLRDKILCNCDVGICTEVPNPFNDEWREFGKAKLKYPSGFIFINNVFYNDFRKPTAIDYSEVIRMWAKKKNIGELKTAQMDSVKLEDLTVRLGYPYVYQHQGDCEHILVFTDMRLLTANDLLSTTDYPRYVVLPRYTTQTCYICGVTAARWICLNSDRLPKEKSYLCQECLVSYNYIDGKKIGEFEAYPYFDNSSLM